MTKYEAVYFVGDNQAINRVRVDSSKTRNRGAFSGSLAALILTSRTVLKLQCADILSTHPSSILYFGGRKDTTLNLCHLIADCDAKSL